jgi:hypothetical protein
VVIARLTACTTSQADNFSSVTSPSPISATSGTYALSGYPA